MSFVLGGSHRVLTCSLRYIKREKTTPAKPVLRNDGVVKESLSGCQNGGAMLGMPFKLDKIGYREF